MSQTAQQLTKEEKKRLSEILDVDSYKEKEKFYERIKRISALSRALEGKNIEFDSIIEQLIDIKDIKERSRYPTYNILSLVVYLNNIADLNPQASSCRKWAETLSKALISYKGEGRKEAIEFKRGYQTPSQEFNLGFPGQPKEARPVKKAHFWSRAPKQQERVD